MWCRQMLLPGTPDPLMSSAHFTVPPSTTAVVSLTFVHSWVTSKPQPPLISPETVERYIHLECQLTTTVNTATTFLLISLFSVVYLVLA
jgi:hypothetical protein